MLALLESPNADPYFVWFEENVDVLEAVNDPVMVAVGLLIMKSLIDRSPHVVAHRCKAKCFL